MVEVVSDPQPMYNLTVADAHTFFVGDGQWLVHNTGDCDWIDEIINKRAITIPEGVEPVSALSDIGTRLKNRLGNAFNQEKDTLALLQAENKWFLGMSSGLDTSLAGSQALKK